MCCGELRLNWYNNWSQSRWRQNWEYLNYPSCTLYTTSMVQDYVHLRPELCTINLGGGWRRGWEVGWEVAFGGAQEHTTDTFPGSCTPYMVHIAQINPSIWLDDTCIMCMFFCVCIYQHIHFDALKMKNGSALCWLGGAQDDASSLSAMTMMVHNTMLYQGWTVWQMELKVGVGMKLDNI